MKTYNSDRKIKFLEKYIHFCGQIFKYKALFKVNNHLNNECSYRISVIARFKYILKNVKIQNDNWKIKFLTVIINSYI